MAKTRSTSSETWFEVFATQSETNDHVVAGTRLALAYGADSGGYPYASETATPWRFKTQPTPSQLRQWVGAPWWIKFDPEAVEITKVTVETVRIEGRTRVTA